jgi:hypothetical protein
MEDEPWLNAGVAAALAKQYTEHQREFVDSLAALLESALPKQVQVTRQRKLLGWDRPVQALQLELGDYRYVLDTPKGVPAARRVLLNRGIVLKTVELPLPEWIAEVGAALEDYAQRHEEAASALRQFFQS